MMDERTERDFDRVLFSGHAVRRMFERGLSKDDVLGIVRDGEVIADYPEDEPYPSYLQTGPFMSFSLMTARAARPLS